VSRGAVGSFIYGGWWSDSLDLGITVPTLLAERYVAMVAERASARAGVDGDKHIHMRRAEASLSEIKNSYRMREECAE